MIIPVRALLGMGSVPFHRSSASEWLQSKNISTIWRAGNGGKTELVNLSDLPIPERRVYLERVIDRAGLSQGDYDEEAHDIFWAAPVSMQAKAQRKAAIACLEASIRQSVRWPDRIALVQKRLGQKGT